MARWRLCLAGLLLLQGCELGRPSELAFLLEPADVIAVRDRPLVLHCQVEGEPPISITWHKDGAPLGNGSHTAVLANGSLRIESFHRRPRGEGAANQTSVGDYSCAAQNRDGLLVSRKARVQLATLSKFHMHPESMAVEEGGVARFQCFVQGVPEATITWERNRTALPPGDHRFTLLPAGILHITGVRRADVGSYRCVATNIANSRCSQEAQLVISGERGPRPGVGPPAGAQSRVSAPKLYKEPMILSGPQNLTITVHQTAVLECIATGNPQPIVSWSRLDGRSIGVEGIQVLGTGNLMISDVSVKHAGVYVCAANRPGTRVRRTAQGILMVQAPPEFVQWPQSMSKPLGSSAIFTCVAQGVPEPHLVWLKNGRILAPGENIKLTHNNSSLLIQGLTVEDEAIYQCIAENSAGTNQASARLAVTLAQEPPSSPEGVRAAALSTTSIQVSWQEPPPEVTEGLIGYVLHIRRAGESDSRELQEAVSKTTFQHLFTGLAPATTYCIRLRAYSPLGASQDSEPVLATTLGSKPSAAYELRLQAFNGNGDSNSTVRVVRLEGSGPTLDADPACPCRPGEESSLPGVVVGVHIGMACIIFCLLFLMLGYHRSLFCRKGAQDSWTVPRGAELAQPGARDAPHSLCTQPGEAKPVEMIDLIPQTRPRPDVPHVEVPIEHYPPPQPPG
ncbi:immunoglobulin superfamily DCC subclass member 3-like isoform X3 [Chrysemys picta bellii]|uniref:immunoglobulin superfamily DCC subclass member 3-like isoform X3 n=1 Tax=Chrysemys picta bellii TaxID=8478 RepID=UPI0032B1BA08